MREFYFEKLDVWKDSRSFIKDIYILTNKFPSDEKFGIISQIRRASLSISANIAEGITRNSNKDKARFINLAFGSTIEVINFLIIANDLGIISDKEYVDLREKCEKITNALNSLHKRLNKQDNMSVKE